VERQVIDVGGDRFGLLVAGAGDPVLFLHGNGCRATYWAPQLEALSTTARCIALDQRGFGASGPLQGVPSLGRYADDAGAVLGRLGVERATVVGLSLGGLVAQALALRHPTVVERLVLAGCPTLAMATEGPRPPTIDAEVLGGLLRASFSPRYRAAHPERVEAFAVEATDPQTVATVAGWLTAPSAAEEGLTSAAIDAEVLVIGGGDDELCPPAAIDALADAIPGARRAISPGAGHLMNLEQPDAFNQLVRSVLR
jgi:3-oxoadipate enol-lactonase